MKYRKLIIRIQVLLFPLFLSLTSWSQPPPNGNNGGTGSFVYDINAIAVNLLVFGVAYCMILYVLPIVTKK